ncbi:hypothetical protein IQ22_04469 [Pseudomonas duriflava]|uniref:Uncharacterized protein n=1 Tax=Pseudomonas duriflava TaxID=459528 RepID=A0A562PQZ1_9PSED|nr:suppressor of fused domain protein [Pseudomonas duriflava]TWI46852.1 hypothetical protein IQ22_04469 [Pseudomonas duriflava]
MSRLVDMARSMNLRLARGAEALLERFDKHGISDIIRIDRQNVFKKRFGFFQPISGVWPGAIGGGASNERSSCIMLKSRSILGFAK